MWAATWDRVREAAMVEVVSGSDHGAGGEVVEGEVVAEGNARSVERMAAGTKEATMPRGDGTGPEGKGPMTGRGAGPCAGNDAAGFESTGRRRGFGRRFGRGGGRARRNRLRGRGAPGGMRFGWGVRAADVTRDQEEGSDS